MCSATSLQCFSAPCTLPSSLASSLLRCPDEVLYSPELRFCPNPLWLGLTLAKQ